MQASGVAESSVRPRFADFPLWHAVPVEAFAVLGKGSVNGTQWGAYAFRRTPKPRDRVRPCLTLASISEVGAYGYVSTCGPLEPDGSDWEFPTYVARGGATRSAPRGVLRGETMLAMTFIRSVRTVRITLGSGAEIARVTRLLSLSQGKKANLGRFRYVAFALRKDVCIAGVTASDQVGNVILDVDSHECGAR